MKTMWAGRIISGVAVLFMVFDGVIHVVKPAVVVQAFQQLGYPQQLSAGIGVLELVLVALYLTRRSAFLGAVLLTGYLGGAVATQLRAGADAFPIVFPVIIGALFWVGLVLRDVRLRALVANRA